MAPRQRGTRSSNANGCACSSRTSRRSKSTPYPAIAIVIARRCPSSRTSEQPHNEARKSTQKGAKATSGVTHGYASVRSDGEPHRAAPFALLVLEAENGDG